MNGTSAGPGPADDRQPLTPGFRVGQDYLILKTAMRGDVSLSYDSLRLADQTNVTLHEFFPRGLAARGDDNRVVPVRGWENEFASALDGFARRAARLAGLDAPALLLPQGEIEDLGTLYIVTANADGPTLPDWAGNSMRRPSDADIARLALRLAASLQTLHGAGLGHGSIEDSQIHLTEPRQAMLGGLMAEAPGVETAAPHDVRALAAALYGVVTGRRPPPENRDRSLDARFASRHMVASDYDDGLLSAIDAALEFGEEASPVEPAAWLAQISACAVGLLGREGDAPRPASAGIDAEKPGPISPARAAPRTVAAASASRQTDTPVARQERAPGRSMRFVAVAGLLLAGVAGWLGYLLLGNGQPTRPMPQAAVQTSVAPTAAPATSPASPAPLDPDAGPSTPASPRVTIAATTTAPSAPSAPEPAPPAATPRVAVQTPAAPKATPPTLSASPAAPEKVAAEPGKPASPPVTAAAPTLAPSAPSAPEPAPQSPPSVSPEVIAGAASRETLLALAGQGADRTAIMARLGALGYVPVDIGSETLFRKPGGGESWRDCSLCPELVLVPPGSTTMQVTIADATSTLAFRFDKPLAVARFEVTRGEFAAFVRETGRTGLAGCHARKPEWGLKPALSWDNPGFVQQNDHPVVCVSFQDATAYAEWLSARTGQRYRLPADAEWHYVAAAEGWGVEESELCRIGNGADLAARAANPSWEAAACKDGFAETSPVGRFSAGRWGLHDLNGNVWEWVSTCAPDPTPEAVFPPVNCPPGAPRLLRGGSWADAPRLRQLDSRVISAPTVRDQVAGFRVVREY